MTNEELIVQLKSLTATGDAVTLVVGFKDHSRLISSLTEEKEALSDLNKLVSDGGTPLGLIVMKKLPNMKDLFFKVRLLPEHIGEAAANQAMRAIVTKLVAIQP